MLFSNTMVIWYFFFDLSELYFVHHIIQAKPKDDYQLVLSQYQNVCLYYTGTNQ